MRKGLSQERACPKSGRVAGMSQRHADSDAVPGLVSLASDCFPFHHSHPIGLAGVCTITSHATQPRLLNETFLQAKTKYAYAHLHAYIHIHVHPRSRSSLVWSGQPGAILTWSGLAWLVWCLVRSGVENSRSGLVSPGLVWSGVESSGSGLVWPGLAWRGKVRPVLVLVWSDLVWCGKFLVWSGLAWSGLVWCGKFPVWSGLA